jgi:hypothetical protein
MGRGHKYTEEEREFIKAHAKGISYKTLADLFNKTFHGADITEGAMNAYFGNHHMTNGGDGRFQKGHVSHNKGLKGIHYSPATEFKPGRMPKQYLPIGTEVLSKDGYLMRKIADTKPSRKGWKSVHRIVYEAANGQIPPRHKLIFTDGDKTNISLDNLVLVSNSQWAIMCKNHLTSPDPELMKAGLLIANLMSTAARRVKQMKERRK